MRATALFLSATVLLSACALPLPDKPVRAQAFDLGPALAAPASPATGIPVSVDQVQAPAALESSAIVYRLLYAGGDQQPRLYSQARWSMAPALLVGQRLREALAVTHPVLDPGSGLAPLELQAELQEYAQVFSATNTSEGVVRLRVTLMAPLARQHRLVGQRTFVARHPAPSADAAGGVQALRAATDEVVQNVVTWINGLPVKTDG